MREKGREGEGERASGGQASLLHIVEAQGGRREGKTGRGERRPLNASKRLQRASKAGEGRRRGSTLLRIEIGASALVSIFCDLLNKSRR